MKPALLLIAPFLLPVNKFTGNVKNEKTFYYYCDSHSMDPQSVKGKQVILYTEVYKITCEEERISDKTVAWAALVDAACENERGCTSDLNYYETKEEAETRLKETKKHYSDTEKYTLKKMELKE